MSQILSAEELKKIGSDLQAAVAEFSATAKSLQAKQDDLEKEMLASLEEEKIRTLKKKLL